MNRVKPIGISGIGALSCIGQTANDNWHSVQSGTSGIYNGLGEVPDSWLQVSNVPKSLHESRAAVLAFLSLQEALQAAKWQNWQQDTALVLATTVGQISLWEKEIPQFLTGHTPETIAKKAIHSQPLGQLLTVLQDALELKGPSYLITTACSAAGQAIAIGAQLIRSGRVKRCLVGGVEILSQLTIQGFRSLKLLSESIAKPFDQNREGINLSEGSAWLALEDTTDATTYLLGSGLGTDAYHMTAPHPEGNGLVRAIQEALITSELQNSKIDWIHAHGTGSQANDLAENQAIIKVFGSKTPPVASTKGLHGHLLGASGILEAVICVKALESARGVATFNLTHPDPHITINLEKPQQPVRRILKTTLGFGGSNAAFVLSHREGL